MVHAWLIQHGEAAAHESAPWCLGHRALGKMAEKAHVAKERRLRGLAGQVGKFDTPPAGSTAWPQRQQMLVLLGEHGDADGACPSLFSLDADVDVMA
jgi:hypothetical protein